MANVFDQFDAPAPAAPVAGATNPFDQFDAAPPALQPPASGADVSARATAALQPFFERGLAARNSAGQWTPEARARLTKEGLNPLEIDHDQEKALLAAYQAQTGARTGDGAAAIGRGLINGIPVAGPALLSGTNKAAAFLRSISYGIPYSQALKDVEGFGERTANANSGATTAGEIAGGVLGTAPAVIAAPAAFGAGAGSLALRSAASAVTSGALGAADSAARSGGDLDATLRGGAAGTALGILAPGVGALAGRAGEAVASRIRPGEAIPAIPDLKSAARAAYDRADDAGVQVAQPAFADAVKGIGTGLREAGIDRTLHPKATAVLARLDEAAGTAPTLQDLDLLRRVAKGAASSLEPDERRLGKLVVDKLDDFVNGLKPADLLTGDAEAATKALGEARGLWARASKAQRIEDAVEGAERQAASVGSGGNVNNATRQAIRRILDNPKQRAGYTADEIEAMEAIVRGGSVQNALRLIGKLSPQGNGLMAALGLGATAANPLMAAGPIAGLVAKKVADRGTTNAVQRLSDLVRSGGDLPVSPLALPAREGTEQLARFVTAPLPIYADQMLIGR